ncbi:MAG: hypothetical protein H6839_11925 [Planctomycetes bacterium]|nr:hypothetical protein [Planctomycetota bacterium]
MNRNAGQKWLLPAVLACATVVCVAAGCSPENSAANNSPSNAVPVAINEPAPTPEVQQPDKPTGIDWTDWMHDRPFVSAMRLMWVDCGVIIGNSYHPDIADMDLLRYSAESLSQRSENFARHFRALRDANRDSATSARAGDWDKAREQNEDAHRSCGGCHFEFWPLQAREFVADTLKGWHENQDVFGDEPWGKQVFTAPAPVRLSMITMRDNMQKAAVAIDAQNLDEFLAATKVLHGFADKQLSIWDGIKHQAEAIAQLARENKLDGVGDHYNKLTSYCHNCHETSSDGRGINPLPWKQE